MKFNEYIELEQFSLDKKDKEKHFLSLFNDLNEHHYIYSDEYKRVSNIYFDKEQNVLSIGDAPFLPVSIFKNKLLTSVPEQDIYKILKSSGTTGSVPSQIVLDKETAALQTFTLSKILSHILGKARLPMLIIDSKSVLKDRKSFTARGAGILGLSIFGKKHLYALDNDFELLKDELREFVKKYNGEKILIFGFTFMVWKYLATTDLDFEIDLSNAILIHSGGWKKLQSIAVDNPTFKKKLCEKFKIKPENIYNFYGMVEQVGSVFLENSDGYLHCPNFSEIIIRDPRDFSILPHGEEGLIQILSILPKSYPGHSLLTEDIGVIMGEDDASNGWKGKYFKILGRTKKAEIRGCSDTFKK
jgi:phenylacetate-coenzyme A ligase PaaK-like adenylate-forming protein